MKRLLLALLFLSVPALAEANACLSAAACATAPCNFNTAGNWTSCGGVVPTATDTWTVQAGHTVVLRDTGLSVGRGIINGTFVTDENPNSVSANGFMIFTVNINGGGAGDEIDCNNGGTIRLRWPLRLAFAGAGVSTFAYTNGCVVDIQGRILETTVTAVTASDEDAPTCGGTTGRKYVITPDRAGTLAVTTHKGRRVVVQSGSQMDRHYEIADVPSASTFTICTDLADGTSTGAAFGGQRLTGHVASVGAFGNGAHSTQTPVAGASTYDILAGDRIAIVQDVIIEPGAASNGWRFRDSNDSGTGTGMATIPCIRGANLNGCTQEGGNSPCAVFDAATLGQSALACSHEFNNWHDPADASFSAHVLWRGWDGLLVQWNHLGDFPANSAQTCGFCFHQERTNESSAQTQPIKNVTVRYNDFARYPRSAININDTNSGASGTEKSAGIDIAFNRIRDGCSVAVGITCAGIEANALSGYIRHNVISNTVRTAAGAGVCITAAGENNDGLSINDNWCVNSGDRGIELLDGDGTGILTANHRVGVTHNYISNLKGPTANVGGRWYSGVIKNVGMAATGTGVALSNPIRAYGTALYGIDDALDSVAPCNGASGCAKWAFQFWNSTGNNDDTSGVDVILQDILAVRMDSSSAGGGVHAGNGGGGQDPRFSGTISNMTIDARGNTHRGMRVEFGDGDTKDVTWAFNDMLTTNLNGGEATFCTADTDVAETVGVWYSNQLIATADDGGGMGGSCTSGSVTRTRGTGYNWRTIGDYNLHEGVPALTAGSGGGAVGIRAFRFSRARLSAPWGGTLPFDGEFPKDIANGVSNADTDGDGAMDLHDNCDSTWNPSQYDADADGKGCACDSGETCP